MSRKGICVWIWYNKERNAKYVPKSEVFFMGVGQKNKVLLGAALAFFLAVGNAFSATLDEMDFITHVDAETIQALKQPYLAGEAKHPVPARLLAKDYALNEYEVIMIGEDLRNELENKPQSKTAPTIWNVIQKYGNAYRLATQRDVPAKLNKSSENQQPSSLDNIQSYIDAMERIANKDEDAPVPEQSPISEKTPEQYAEQASKATTPEEKRAAFSLLDIDLTGNANNTESLPDNAAEVTPSTEFNRTMAGKLEPSENVSPPDGQKTDGSDMAELIQMATDAIIDKQTEKAKNYYVYAYHTLDYIDEHGSGNIPLRTDVVDDHGNYYQPVVTDQYQLEHALEVGIGTTIADSIDVLFGITVKNEDGIIGGKGTTWRFSNVRIVPRAEGLRLKKIKNATGIDVSEGGKELGLDIGHGTRIVGRTDDGEIGLLARSETGKMSLSRSGGLQVENMNGKYFFNIGKLSLDFSTYTLQLSDCKAIELGYIDDNHSLIFIAGKPHSSHDGSEDGKTIGRYNRFLYAAQYIAKKLIPNMELAFNFATSNDTGSIAHPNGAVRGKTTVYSIAFQSGELPDTQFQGELAHSVNQSGDKSYSGNADFLDVTHRFSKRMSGVLHAVNIDGTFDASSLVEDKTGEYLYTTNQGDGKADYLYDKGQRGFDLELQYVFPENAAISFGLSRYSMTTNGNAKTDIYLGGQKSWSINDEDGNQIAEIGVQQRFERLKVSDTKYIQHSSTTTVSATGRPWKDAVAETNWQRILDNAEGNQSRFDFSLEHNFYPLERVVITPRIEYQRKKGDKGLSANSSEMDSTTLVNSLSIGYEIVPDELTVNVLFSKEKYDVRASEIDKATGRKVDGENRRVTGAGIGLTWEPKKIPGLTAEISYRKDKVEYITPAPDLSHQNIWEYSVEYSQPIGKNIRAAISYDYRAARDRAKPIYDEVTRTASVSLDASLGQNSTLRLEHSYESEYKPLDPKANHKTQTTIARIYNSF